MPHAGTSTVRQHIEQPRIGWPVEQSGNLTVVCEIYFQICGLTDHHKRYLRSCSRPIAPARSGDSVSTSESGSFFSFFMRASAFSMVKLLISKVASISLHFSGMDTGPTRQRPSAERSNEQPAGSVLQIVDVDLAGSSRDLPGDCSNLRQLRHHQSGEQLTQASRLIVPTLAPERDHDVKPRGAAGLHEVGQPDFFAERVCGLCYLDDVAERRVLRVQVQNAPIGSFDFRSAAPPDVKWDGAKIHEIEKCGFVVADEVVDLALCLLAPHALGADPLRREAGRILLKKGLAADPIRIASQYDRPVL